MTSLIDRVSLNERLWPALPLAAWADTYATLHRWVQIVGKIRLRLSPPVNHWWQSTLYVSPRGLTTGTIYYGARAFVIEFDFIEHALRIHTAEGAARSLALAPKSVAAFYEELMALMRSLNIELQLNLWPQELPNPVRFDQDREHEAYDPTYAQDFWTILLQADRLFNRFRAEFIGKASPSHFFWGSFDLAVTRFSGRRAPARPGADAMTREAYSHEVISAGFWPGSGNIDGAAFYAYAAPEPAGFSAGAVQPEVAFYNPPTQGFVLMYDAVRTADDPDRMVLDFLRSTYRLGADLGRWNVADLERPNGAGS